MKIQDLLNEQKTLEKERKLLVSQKRALGNRINLIEKTIDKFLFENKLYIPIKELEKYKGICVESITLVDDKGYDEDWCGGEIMEIDENGHFYYSDYESGIYEYNENIGKYRKAYHCSLSEGDTIVGFYNLVLSDKKVEESFKENILKKVMKEEINGTTNNRTME